MSDRVLIGFFALLVTVGLALLLPRIAMFFIGGGYYTIPSASMEPTLRVGDAVLALPVDDAKALERGTVVVYRHRTGDVEYIARIVGLPGDRIAMRNGRLILNDTPVEAKETDDYLFKRHADRPLSGENCSPLPDAGLVQCTYQQFRETLPNGPSYEVLNITETPADNVAEIKVGDGAVFVLGDNRDNAVDSRFAQVGQIPLENVTHTAWIRYLDLSGKKMPDDRFLDRIN
jgi:signal peptidase I